MTRLTKPVTRESGWTHRGRPMIVTLHPTWIEIHAKGTRRRYTIGLEECFWLAVKRQLAEDRREKEQARKAKRGRK